MPEAAMIALASSGGCPGGNTVLLIIGQLVPRLRKEPVSAKLFSTRMSWMELVQRWSHFEPRMLLTTGRGGPERAPLSIQG